VTWVGPSKNGLIARGSVVRTLRGKEKKEVWFKAVGWGPCDLTTAVTGEHVLLFLTKGSFAFEPGLEEALKVHGARLPTKPLLYEIAYFGGGRMPLKRSSIGWVLKVTQGSGNRVWLSPYVWLDTKTQPSSKGQIGLEQLAELVLKNEFEHRPKKAPQRVNLPKPLVNNSRRGGQ
jgi:hypothetical protein